jgi:hypothetical protein
LRQRTGQLVLEQREVHQLVKMEVREEQKPSLTVRAGVGPLHGRRRSIVPSPGLAAWTLYEWRLGSLLLLRKGGWTETGVTVDAEQRPLHKVALGMRLGGRLLRRKKEEKEKLRKKEEKRHRSKKNFGSKVFIFGSRTDSVGSRRRRHRTGFVML